MTDGHGGRAALERLGRDLAERETERETREMLKVARVEARRDQARDAVGALATIMEELWQRVTRLAPTTMAFSPQRLELELALLDWDIEHEYVNEHAFERAGWDVFAGGWLRLQQRSEVYEYPGRSTSLWYAKVGGDATPAWYEVAYNAAEGNAPSEEPFALKDLIKADLVASTEQSNLFHAAEPLRLEGSGIEAFYDRWMGLLAGAALGELERPTMSDDAAQAARARDVELEAERERSEQRSSSLIGRLRNLGD